MLQLLGSAGEELLGFTQFADIRVRAEPTENFAVGSANGKGAGEKPAVLPICAPQWKRVFPVFPVLQLAAPFLHNSFQVVGMEKRFQAPALHLLEGCFSERGPP